MKFKLEISFLNKKSNKKKTTKKTKKSFWKFNKVTKVNQIKDKDKDRGKGKEDRKMLKWNLMAKKLCHN